MIVGEGAGTKAPVPSPNPVSNVGCAWRTIKGQGKSIFKRTTNAQNVVILSRGVCHFIGFSTLYVKNVIVNLNMIKYCIDNLPLK